MMMQMLEAGGVPILTDRIREADEDNPRGYYELEAVKQTRTDASWLDGTGGRAVKMVTKLLYDLPLDREYKVILMRRDMGETLASQQTMLARSGAGTSGLANGEVMARIFDSHLSEVTQWLGRQPNIQFLEVWHGAALQEPRGTAIEVATFLGENLDTEAMSGVVDLRLYRERRCPAESEED